MKGIPMSSKSLSDDKPWWTYGHVWLVISGPLAVIFACMVTFYFIANSPNEIISGQDVEIEHIRNSKTIESGNAPAEMARNHAATGVIPAPKVTLVQPK
jgi:hypothetical protein